MKEIKNLIELSERLPEAVASAWARAVEPPTLWASALAEAVAWLEAPPRHWFTLVADAAAWAKAAPLPLAWAEAWASAVQQK